MRRPCPTRTLVSVSREEGGANIPAESWQATKRAIVRNAHALIILTCSPVPEFLGDINIRTNARQDCRDIGATGDPSIWILCNQQLETGVGACRIELRPWR